LTATDYSFITEWRVEAAPDEVFLVLTDPLSLPRWWPEVYLFVKKIDDGAFELHTRGWLPYTLRWRFRVVESVPPERISLMAWGDLNGSGIWTLRRHGLFTDIRYEWNVSAGKPFLRHLSFVLKPVFRANHRWAMARGQQDLKAELVRRRASSHTAQAFGAFPGASPHKRLEDDR
jgi:uncharacterized protein YndB with AHSA1/START domain